MEPTTFNESHSQKCARMIPSVCHKGTSRFRWATLGAIACGVLLGQSAQDLATPKWRKIGNSAVDLPLAAPATGPVDAVWFSPDGTRLYARTHSGSLFETVDFQNWTAAAVAPGPAPDVPVTIQRAPAPNVRYVSAQDKVFAIGQQIFRTDDNGVSWMNLTAYRTQSIIGSGQHSLAVSKNDPEHVVVANDFGVWSSMDGGLSWTGLNQGLPAMP